MCFRLQQVYRHNNDVGMERREIQLVTMHAGVCDAAYCLVSAKKRAQRLYGHVAGKKTTRRLCPPLSLTRRLRNTD